MPRRAFLFAKRNKGLKVKDFGGTVGATRQNPRALARYPLGVQISPMSVAFACFSDGVQYSEHFSLLLSLPLPFKSQRQNVVLAHGFS